MSKREKIGIMGGTFDPIHIGHLITAETVRAEYGLDKIIFIPAGSPPHKKDFKIAPAGHRYAMTVIATKSNRSFSVSSLEQERDGLSYTVDTVQSLLLDYENRADFYFIVGADMLKDLTDWKDIEHLLTLCRFVVVARPGSTDQINELIKNFSIGNFSPIEYLAAPEIEISSTDIRERIKTGRSVKYIVPESVEEYIKKHNLYIND
jgi:nicotinate-nucleotide adenylyltransferase